MIWILCADRYKTKCEKKTMIMELQGVHLILCFFPRILESLPPLPRRHSAAIGCTKNYQPIGVTLHSHCVGSFEALLQRCRRGGDTIDCKKNTIFPELPVG